MANSGYITKASPVVIGNTTFTTTICGCGQSAGGLTPGTPRLPSYYSDHPYIVVERDVQCTNPNTGCPYNCQYMKFIPTWGGQSGVRVGINGNNCGLTTQGAGIKLEYTATHSTCSCAYCTYDCYYYTYICLSTEAVNYAAPSAQAVSYDCYRVSRAPYTAYFCNTCTGSVCLGTLTGNDCSAGTVTTAVSIALPSQYVCCTGNNYIIVCCGGSMGPVAVPWCRITCIELAKPSSSASCEYHVGLSTNYIL